MEFYYHADHLGSSSYITNLDGQIVQHVEYVPFGEVFIEERNNSWNTPYLFNDKELDEETGTYYYGARYYKPRESVWLSTDPMAEKYPNVSPYAYTFQNPIKYTDPNGEEPTPKEAVEMADNIYEGKVGDILSGGWRLDKIYTSDASSSFKAGVYSRTISGVTEYAMVNAGTYFEGSKRGVRSMWEDIKQVLLNSYLNVALGAGPIGKDITLPSQSLNPITNHLMSSVKSALYEYQQSEKERATLKQSQIQAQQGFSQWLQQH